jgi:hypothetical protein
MALVISPSAQAKAKITKPAPPTVVSVTASAPKKGLVNVVVKIRLSKSNGGSKITGSKVVVSGKSCTMDKLKATCTIVGLKSGKKFSAKAASKNIKGFGAYGPAYAFRTHTVIQWNAISKAKSYLAYSSFSRSGLIGQLEYEGFSTEEATYGVDQLSTDWMLQAVKKAKSYLEYSSFSRSGLIGQLEYEGFSTEEATYGVDQPSTDWMLQAVKKAESYLEYSSFSRSGLIGQLEYEGFSTEEATYGVTQNGL